MRRYGRDANHSFRSNVQLGAALGVGAFLGAAAVALLLAAISPLLPASLRQKLPAPGAGGSP